MIEDEQKWEEIERRGCIAYGKQATRKRFWKTEVYFKKYSKQSRRPVVKPFKLGDRLTCLYVNQIYPCPLVILGFPLVLE